LVLSRRPIEELRRVTNRERMMAWFAYHEEALCIGHCV
jgi:hypothetical protein